MDLLTTLAAFHVGAFENKPAGRSVDTGVRRHWRADPYQTDSPANRLASAETGVDSQCVLWRGSALEHLRSSVSSCAESLTQNGGLLRETGVHGVCRNPSPGNTAGVRLVSNSHPRQRAAMQCRESN